MSRRFSAYPKYKNSGVYWLEEVPSSWGISKVKYLSPFQVGWTPPTGNDENFNGDNLWANISDLGDKTISNTAKRISDYAAKVASMNITPKGSLLYSFKLTVGSVSFAGRDMYTNEAIASFLEEGKLPLPYLYFALPKFVIENASTNIYGARILNQELIKNAIMLAPSYAEAETIANFLDHETAKIDTLIDKQQQLIKLLKEKRQAVISHAVTKGLNPAAPMKDSGVEWFDQTPDHWKIIEFKFAAEDGRKTFTDGDWVESPYITDSGVRLLQTGNVGKGFYKEQGFRYVSEDTFRALNCTEVKPGDVLICRLDGPVGRSCLAPNLNVKMITSVDNAILKPNVDFDSRYLVYLTNSTPWLEWIQDLCRVGGGFRLRISRTMLGDQRIPAPPVEEQTKIADSLDKLSNHTLECIKRCEKSIILLQERRTALISAAVTGKIDVRNWQPAQPRIPMEASA